MIAPRAMEMVFLKFLLLLPLEMIPLGKESWAGVSLGKSMHDL